VSNLGLGDSDLAESDLDIGPEHRDAPEWLIDIGMEVHVQPLTRSKMFCGCAIGELGDSPNSNVCEICLGLPGVLPVVNRAAVEACLKAALALHCTIKPHTKFDRKNYMYPDLPKGYQISQYDLPIGINGYFDFQGRRVQIRRVHLEEDTGKLVHPGDKLHKAQESYVDLNRAGVPLMEIVTEPELRSADEARHYAMELRELLRTIGASEAEMEKGQMRVEPNISIFRVGSKGDYGVKTELKNINSFRSLHRAIVYEVDRQVRILESGGIVAHETRGWSEAEQRTFSQRSKEFAEDYRYFPEPDLPPLAIDSVWVEELREFVNGALDRLPARVAEWLESTYQLRSQLAHALASARETAAYFEEAAKLVPPDPEYWRTLANWVVEEVIPFTKSARDMTQLPLTPQQLANLVGLIKDAQLSHQLARELQVLVAGTSEMPDTVAAKRGLSLISADNQIQMVLDDVLAENTKAVADYLNGRQEAFGFLLGKVREKSAGRIDMKKATELLRQRLSS
jgi:aspartyl-tRNA(Asn)/glutamyl-tRNA(Gln) amidotransferase subunit B